MIFQQDPKDRIAVTGALQVYRSFLDHRANFRLGLILHLSPHTVFLVPHYFTLRILHLTDSDEYLVRRQTLKHPFDEHPRWDRPQKTQCRNSAFLPRPRLLESHAQRYLEDQRTKTCSALGMLQLIRADWQFVSRKAFLLSTNKLPLPLQPGFWQVVES